jgi:hypothetical protein
MDPFLLFGGYATEWLTGATMITLTPGQSWSSIQDLRKVQLAIYGAASLPNERELQVIFERLSRTRQITAEDLVAPIPPGRRPFVERGLLWLAKYQVVTILRRSTQIAVSALD